jgi:hypothetical protein
MGNLAVTPCSQVLYVVTVGRSIRISSRNNGGRGMSVECVDSRTETARVEEIIAAVEKAQMDICIDMGHGEVNEVLFNIEEALRLLDKLRLETIRGEDIPPTTLTIDVVMEEYGSYWPCSYCDEPDCSACPSTPHTAEQERAHRERLYWDEFQLGHPMNEND